jgi:methylenetetrahydrofolate--tRNA-(uracil-5-)-methyltransferase
MNANFGLLPPLDVKIRNKAERRKRLVERALDSMGSFAATLGATQGASVS